uniref:Uncharacterized protein n=1 Tax=Arundo donax TaxID=35708 RepID=A0A0A9AU34_ARUDO
MISIFKIPSQWIKTIGNIYLIYCEPSFIQISTYPTIALQSMLDITRLNLFNLTNMSYTTIESLNHIKWHEEFNFEMGY